MQIFARLAVGGDSGRPPSPEQGVGAAVLRLFAITWAMATFVHLWANPASLSFLRHPGLLGGVHAVLALLALAALLRPDALGWLIALALLQVYSAWLEMPFIGNHWLLVALVALGFLAAVLSTSVKQASRWDREAIIARFLPTARTLLLFFYSFAAFSKLNHGFFTPARSCGRFYAAELANAYSLPAPATSGWSAWIPVIGTVAIECSIPLLLLFRRTRYWGVVLGLAFHGLIGLDPVHLFTDFSSVLLALFLLFLPGDFALRVQWNTARRAAAGVAAALTLALWFSRGGMPEWLMAAGQIFWFVYYAAMAVAVVIFLVKVRPRAEPYGLRIRPRWLVLVPLLAVFNGLTPYLELKTGFGWNMYSNLATVDGRSNHLLIRRTLPLSGAQRHLVRILASDDPGLQPYARDGFLLALPQLRAYVSRNPSVRLRYELDGVVHDDARAGADPLLDRPVPAWQEKLQLFRAVDSENPPRCLDRWGAAR